MTREAREGARERMKEAFGGLDFVSREEFDAVKDMAARAREENARLEARHRRARGEAGEVIHAYVEHGPVAAGGFRSTEPSERTRMSFTIYDASVPVFASTLTNMRAWLDKAAGEGDPAALVEARLAEDTKAAHRAVPVRLRLGEERDRPAARDRPAGDARYRVHLRRAAGALRQDRGVPRERRSRPRSPGARTAKW